VLAKAPSTRDPKRSLYCRVDQATLDASRRMCGSQYIGQGTNAKGGRGMKWAAIGLGLMLLPCPAQSASFSVSGVTFSDKLGGFVLERVTGHGSVDDPFVGVEGGPNPEGGTLLFRADPAFGNRIGSIDQIGFALVKVVENMTGHPWTSFELELQSKLGIPSDDLDELSFGQGSTAGRPFTATSFSLVTI